MVLNTKIQIQRIYRFVKLDIPIAKGYFHRENRLVKPGNNWNEAEEARDEAF